MWQTPWRCSVCQKFVHEGTSVCAVCVVDRMHELGITRQDIAETEPESLQRFQGRDFLNHVDRSDNPFWDMLEGFPVTDSEGRES